MNFLSDIFTFQVESGYRLDYTSIENIKFFQQYFSTIFTTRVYPKLNRHLKITKNQSMYLHKIIQTIQNVLNSNR